MTMNPDTVKLMAILRDTQRCLEIANTKAADQTCGKFSRQYAISRAIDTNKAAIHQARRL